MTREPALDAAFEGFAANDGSGWRTRDAVERAAAVLPRAFRSRRRGACLMSSAWVAATTTRRRRMIDAVCRKAHQVLTVSRWAQQCAGAACAGAVTSLMLMAELDASYTH